MIKDSTFTISSTANTNDLNGPWIIEWSENQQCFHVDLVAASLERNRRAFMLAKSNDYQPILICSSHKEAHEWCEYFREFREEHGKRIPSLEEKILKRHK